MKKTIYIVSPTYNEEDNINLFFNKVFDVTNSLKNYKFIYLFIDNSSTDKTVDLIKKIIQENKNVKLIINNRNFGHIRSPYWGLLQSSGEASIYISSDLQDPPELIKDFILAWEKGFKVALGVRTSTKSSKLFNWLRSKYYNILNFFSDFPQINNATGFGIYDASVLDILRRINDPYPYFRGLIMELGYEIKKIPFIQRRRSGGFSKNNFFTLYDIAILGLVSHSVLPIRLASFLGFTIGFCSICVALIFFVLKILRWDHFPVGYAPLIISIFMMFGILLIFIGLLGEYVATIHRHVRNRPIVVEKERINF